MTEHTIQATALAALTFSDWMLKGAEPAVLASIRSMIDALQEEKSPVKEAAQEAGRALAELTDEALQRAWTQAFCAGGTSVTPHESVALTGLVMQEPRDDVLQWMYEAGLAPSESMHEPADHLGVMLAFWARLLMADVTLDAAHRFADAHLSWIGWISEELTKKQPENQPVLALARLLEAVVADFEAKAG